VTDSLIVVDITIFVLKSVPIWIAKKLRLEKLGRYLRIHGRSKKSE
jgi:hypothetical protein